MAVFPVNSVAQTVLHGTVTDRVGQPVIGVSVKLNNGSISTNANGSYIFKGLTNGQYKLTFSAVGFKTIIKAVNIQDVPDIRLDVRLYPSTEKLAEVSIKTKSELLSAKDQPQNLSVIDTRQYYNRPEGAINLINQVAGVKVRQYGGLGSNADYYLNGLSGKQVKFFIDGIPLDYLGSGLNLNILPVNIIDRIEIYKGVIPVKLGADALGGAIDVITRHTFSNYIDAAYTISSFNTHRANLNLRQSIGKYLFADVSSFYNYADNNYKVDVDLVSLNGNPVAATVTRFHDRYQNYYANATIGLRRQKWADEFSFFTALSANDQQIQNNPIMTQPYGNVNYQENSWNNGLKYAKAWQRFSLNAYVGINQVHGRFTDTSQNTYDWTGQAVVRRSSGGETFGPLQDTKTNRDNRIVRINPQYQLNENTRINASLTGTSFMQTENNPATAAYPVTLTKLVAGVALEKDFFEKNLTSITSVKYFTYGDKGYQFNSGGAINAASASKSTAGWNQALRLLLTDQISAKASYEYASRLPDIDELFGSYVQRTRPNPGLRPEVSHNFNLGVQYNNQRSRLEINGFYRLANNLIYAPPSPFYLLYQNLLKAQVSGIEAEYSNKLSKAFRITINATYQDVVNKTDAANSGDVGGGHYNLRLPNIPFLFANGELQYNKRGTFRKDDQISAWYNASYVHWFYLYWANDGSTGTKATIPTQYVQSSGLSYAFSNNRYGLSFEVQNLADAKAYDNYNVQRPGRSFHLKLRTFIQ